MWFQSATAGTDRFITLLLTIKASASFQWSAFKVTFKYIHWALEDIIDSTNFIPVSLNMKGE